MSGTVCVTCPALTAPHHERYMNACEKLESPEIEAGRKGLQAAFWWNKWWCGASSLAYCCDPFGALQRYKTESDNLAGSET